MRPGGGQLAIAVRNAAISVDPADPCPLYLRVSNRSPAGTMIPSATKSKSTVTPSGGMVRAGGIEGLTFTDVRPVVSHSGTVTELWRPDWLGEDTRPGHVVHVTLNGFAETNWHCHKIQNDLLFVIRGAIKLAFYDDREDSPTYKQMEVLPLSAVRPTPKHEQTIGPPGRTPTGARPVSSPARDASSRRAAAKSPPSQVRSGSRACGATKRQACTRPAARPAPR